MQTSTPIIDLHVHSTLKPYGNSFYPNNDPTFFTNSSSLWFFDYRSRGDLKIEGLLGICRYRQSDFTSMTNGQIKIACVSLYPVEKEFFDIKRRNLKPFDGIIGEFASMFGKSRVAGIMDPEFNYFTDLCKEYQFLIQLDGKETNARTYKMLPDASQLTMKTNLLIIPSFEGCHSFCEGNNPEAPEGWKNLKANVKTVKDWQSPPLFVTFAHHFYNGLCTHARSLFEMSGKLLDQKRGMRDTGITPSDSLPPISERGWELIGLLLSKDNGRRILIDVKHMSLEARKEYYDFLKQQKDNIPVVYSHGAMADEEDKYEINLHVEDLDMIYKTEGIIGLEMDQRILGYNKHRLGKTIKRRIRPETQYYDDAVYFWRQIKVIAEYAYVTGHKEDPWKCIALGSDYDGIINPLNAYPDANWLAVLYQQLIVHLTQYWQQPGAVIPAPAGQDAADIVYRIMYKNAYDFIVKHYGI
jgi:hypothetical protein